LPQEQKSRAAWCVLLLLMQLARRDARKATTSAIFRRRACAESDTGVVGEDHLAADGESVSDRRVVVVEVAMKCWSSTMGAPSGLPKRR
jgi:hypothetical protein